MLGGPLWLAAIVIAACTTTVPPPQETNPATPLVTSAPAPTAAEPPPSTPAAEPPPSTPAAEPPPFPLEATIPELQAAAAEGTLTSVELVEFYLARIEAYDEAGPELNSFIYLNPHALDEAAALDEERQVSGPRGPLHGIPIVVKDNISTFDMPTTAGSTRLADFQPAEDAFQIAKLREAGAIILGKTNLFTYAQGWETKSQLTGQTRSPYDPSRDPGGSSGGTAVAVTANFAAAGLGTDTCGSIRLPASHNNLYGLRPTSGLSSRSGVIPLSPTLDMVGPMTRSVVDLAILLSVTSGQDAADPSTVAVEDSFVDAAGTDGLEGSRLGLVSGWTSGDVAWVIERTLDQLRTHGVELIEISLPPKPAGGSLDRFMAEFPSAISAYFSDYPDSPFGQGPVATIAPDTHETALATRGIFRQAVTELMDLHELDGIIYPASMNTTPRVGGTQPFDCYSASLAGLPALAMPAGVTEDGLPVGIELMGRPFDESTLIAIAAGYEARIGQRVLPPTTPPLDP